MNKGNGTEGIDASQETTEPSHPLTREQMGEAQAAAAHLIAALADVPDGDLVGEIIANAMKLLRDQTNRGDMKLMNSSMKELRYALKIFAPYRDTRKVSIFGSARTKQSDEDYTAAAEFAKQMAAMGWMVITGAGGGIMAAGHGGAGPEPSFGLAIRLPFEQKTNDFIARDKKLINFKYFFTRKLMFVRSSNAIALFPGGFGTMDEGFEVLTLIQTGKSVPMPVVLVEKPGGDYWPSWQQYVDRQLLKRGLINEEDRRLYLITDDVSKAVAEITHFYRNYHSMRQVRDELVFRLQVAPTAEQLEQLQQRYGKVLSGGGRFYVSGPLNVEQDEVSLAHLPRLVFPFNRRDHGQLRMLIDDLNDLPQVATA